MDLNWVIEDQDVRNVKSLLNEMADRPFVAKRREINVENPPNNVSKTDFWKAMIACLLTTQQRSGPKSPVNQFRKTTPYPLGLEECQRQEDVADFVSSVITKFGGIRRGPTIGNYVEHNLKWLDDEGWNNLASWVDPLSSKRTPNVERNAAAFVARNLKGFGPKQSRNFWQQLGLTIWEIPLDSRITKWLNKHNFPVKLTAKALSDRNYYKFISSGFQALCREAETYPCVLDAAIFASYDSPRS
jgi:hypothetical protein